MSARVPAFLWALLVTAALAGCAPAPAPPGVTVDWLNLVLFQGRWHEIASTRPWFQEGCLCTRADYLLHGEELIVENSCRDGALDAPWRKRTGRARAIEGGGQGQLAVTFFWPFQGGYWVLGLAEDYRWAVVGTPDKDKLWVLARTPAMDPADYRAALAMARQKGWPVERLVLTDQGCR